MAQKLIAKKYGNDCHGVFADDLYGDHDEGTRLKYGMKYTAEVAKRNKELQDALADIIQLTGMLPICASCKKIRDDKGYWIGVETYITKHS